MGHRGRLLKNRNFRVLCCAALILLSGCHLFQRDDKNLSYKTPVLPMSISSDELVQYLNRNYQSLSSWRCMKTRLVATVPGLAVRPRLSGHIACEAPRHLRLTAQGFAGRVDVGSGLERCWFHVRPGMPSVLTWRHGDEDLLRDLPTGVPFINTEWMMLVLGMRPLNVADYRLSNGPQGSRELWLVSVEDQPGGGNQRRVVKVDSLRGRISEHAVYDERGNLLVRASLGSWKSVGGHVLPHEVNLGFPQSGMELLLKFQEIELNPVLPENLWQLRQTKSLQIVDVRDLVDRPGFVHAESRDVASGVGIGNGRGEWRAPGASGRSGADYPAFAEASDTSEPDWSNGTTAESPFTDNPFHEVAGGNPFAELDGRGLGGDSGETGAQGRSPQADGGRWRPNDFEAPVYRPQSAEPKSGRGFLRSVWPW